MSLTLPNIDRIAKDNPRLAETLLKVQQFTNQNVAITPGNKVAAPTFVNPTQRPG